jgi:peroxiredoxin
MKIRLIAFSASIVVALAGGMTLMLAKSATPHSIQRSIYYDDVKHPVTPEMIEDLDRREAQKAPFFQVRDIDSKPVLLGGTSASKPQFIYFVMDGCPCSVDVEPLFQKLFEHFGQKVDFVAVTDAKPDIARRWSKQMLMPYGIVSDPKLEIIKAYGAESSAYSALVDQNGTIVKMWPGYSQGILDEMNTRMSDLVGEKKRPFDASYAPKEKASGCAFGMH